MMKLMMSSMIVMVMLIINILISAYAGSNFHQMTLARDAAFDNFLPFHEHYILVTVENTTLKSCLKNCFKRFPLCHGLLYNDKLRVCKVMACLINRRFLEKRDGWIFFGNEEVCEPGWYPFAGRCYYPNKTKVKWSTAKTQCTSQNSYLVEVSSEAENKWISESFLSETGNGVNSLPYAWLGASKRNGILTWRHSNIPLYNQSWLPEHFDSRKNCVLMKPTGMWVDSRCISNVHMHPFVCEKMI